MQTQVAQILDVDMVDRVPTGTYRVKLLNGPTLEHIPQLLPMATPAFSKGAGASNRSTGGAGFLPIAPKGSWCLVMTVGALGLGRGQSFIMGFFSPRRERSGAHQRMRRRIQPGGFDFRTPFGAGFTIHAAGGIEIQADNACERLMVPLSEGGSDTSQALIADLCRNYALNTAAGQVRFGELGKGKAGYHAKIYELSRWSPEAVRKAKNWATGDVDPTTATSDDLAAGAADRYVEIEYGTTNDGGIYRERFVGTQSVEISCDGQGGWQFVADQSCSHQVGALISVEESADGSRAITAGESTYTIAGRVTWLVPEFMVTASLVTVLGVVRFNVGARPGARVMDLVQVGDHIGHIITGDPLFLH